MSKYPPLWEVALLALSLIIYTYFWGRRKKGGSTDNGNKEKSE